MSQFVLGIQHFVQKKKQLEKTKDKGLIGVKKSIKIPRSKGVWANIAVNSKGHRWIVYDQSLVWSDSELHKWLVNANG